LKLPKGDLFRLRIALGSSNPNPKQARTTTPRHRCRAAAPYAADYFDDERVKIGAVGARLLVANAAGDVAILARHC
jgi:hypothetical protein